MKVNIKIITKNWSFDSIFNYLKIGLLPIENEDIYILENYCKKWGIKGSKWYDGDWNFCDENNENKEQLERIKQIRKEIINPLIKLKETINNNRTIGDITKGLYDFLIENKIDKFHL